MKYFPRLIFTVLIVGLTNSAFSQNGVATIRKNTNVIASGLYHDLNKTNDTLILKSDKNRLMNKTYNCKPPMRASLFLDSASI